MRLPGFAPGPKATYPKRTIVRNGRTLTLYGDPADDEKKLAGFDNFQKTGSSNLGPGSLKASAPSVPKTAVHGGISAPPTLESPPDYTSQPSQTGLAVPDLSQFRYNALMPQLQADPGSAIGLSAVPSDFARLQSLEQQAFQSQPDPYGPQALQAAAAMERLKAFLQNAPQPTPEQFTPYTAAPMPVHQFAAIPQRPQPTMNPGVAIGGAIASLLAPQAAPSIAQNVFGASLANQQQQFGDALLAYNQQQAQNNQQFADAMQAHQLQQAIALRNLAGQDAATNANNARLDAFRQQLAALGADAAGQQALVNGYPTLSANARRAGQANLDANQLRELMNLRAKQGDQRAADALQQYKLGNEAQEFKLRQDVQREQLGSLRDYRKAMLNQGQQRLDQGQQRIDNTATYQQALIELAKMRAQKGMTDGRGGLTANGQAQLLQFAIRHNLPVETVMGLFGAQPGQFSALQPSLDNAAALHLEQDEAKDGAVRQAYEAWREANRQHSYNVAAGMDSRASQAQLQQAEAKLNAMREQFRRNHPRPGTTAPNTQQGTPNNPPPIRYSTPPTGRGTPVVPIR